MDATDDAIEAYKAETEWMKGVNESLAQALRMYEQLSARLNAIEAEVALQRGTLGALIVSDSDPVELYPAEPNAPR